ncbi:MAG: hypothetical protein JO097_06470 [Acidobacteriaceae bacterium]|nr:hypothetical protein [Acidobacteriaceae bacterium]MBV9766788.1 hypothetical protein [Acidobacteriaceae bacterium]
MAASAGSIPKQESAWKRYQNQQWGYCVSYPSRWLKGDAFDGAGIFIETGAKRHSKPVAEINIEALANQEGEARQPALTLVESLESHFDGMKKFEHAEQLEILEKREMQFSGNSALFTKDRYYDPQNRARWIEEIILAKRKETLYRLQLECQPDQLTRFEPVFLHFLSTFELDCSTGH